ncbi:DNA endonuclease SmrA [Pantoea stewartii]|uniref:DNA endonuclease n=1 Tax=Pantoea stewartii subsp. stewartii DC283 TaxID=660596 RepID=H3RD04_PANSE|nr:DNA endonuclease SmrA [Pantoea stewartii]ARF50361.1 DNA endonuclease [Pantoea stewartii subsp. stewartii DC283]EHU00680.1 DNA endonuclease [Pantoea stewartii subsp. stewartii DC283]KAB0558826.1 DNA endonuclease SmrA [Pantoea stewartii subsp. stewartii]MEB6533981.1 DNA endonuclease SmrA [Pantoea stewartii]
MNLDDDNLFRDAMNDVTPLKDAENTRWNHSAAGKKVPPRSPEPEDENFLTRGYLDIIPLEQQLEFKAEGIQQGVLDKLRKGQYALDASLNLLRQPVETCRQNLFTFMQDVRKAGYRNLLIIHGKGRDNDSHANIVRSYLDRWLREFDDVQTFCVAQKQHGGSGALYVGLRKTEKARQENWERHAKRSR